MTRVRGEFRLPDASCSLRISDASLIRKSLLSIRSPSPPYLPSSHLSTPLLSVHPTPSLPPSHPFYQPPPPQTHRHSPPPSCSSSASRSSPRKAISSLPLLRSTILRPPLITNQSLSSFRSTIVPSPVTSTPPPTPFSFASVFPLSTSSTYLSVPDVFVKPPTPTDGTRKRTGREWEVEEERVEHVGGMFQDYRFLPPPVGVGRVVGWSG